MTLPRVTLMVSAILPGLLQAQSAPDSTVRVRFGAFVDLYYAWDGSRPAGLDRPYTTQPARHNEFNVNLAHIEAMVSGERVRGRLAMQVGTSVQSNYAAEPRVGTVSGPDLARHIQEAVVGVRVASTLWVDGGIFFSHVGGESWISRDNLTYTRSLIADYSPYYQSGVKLVWQPRPTVSAQLNVVNGWQLISENNSDKSAGIRLDWQVTKALTLSTYNLFGNEQPTGEARQHRYFHGASVRWTPREAMAVQGTCDAGTQSLGDRRGNWYGCAIAGRRYISRTTALVARLERYADPRQVIVSTSGSAGLVANGASLGADVTLAPGMLWRTEWRALRSTQPVFPGNNRPGRGNQVFVTSLALGMP